MPRTRADLRKSGVGRRAIASSGFQRTASGYYRRVRDPTKPVTPTQRIIDAVPLVLEGGPIAGWAAAYAHGVNALDGLDHRTLTPLPVPVLLPPGLRRRDTATVTYRQSGRPVTGETIDDVPVTTSGERCSTWPGLAPDLIEAVVTADAFLGARLSTRRIGHAFRPVGGLLPPSRMCRC